MEANGAPGRDAVVTDGEVLRADLIKRLRSTHALKGAALAMFDPMLRRVASERDSPETSAEVAELLTRMHSAFSGHRDETAGHAARLEQRMRQLGGRTARLRIACLSSGARAWVALSGLGGQNHGANARNAFVFEHLEIASLNLLRELALRADDDRTAQLADSCRAADEEMAATINRNWTNVLTLTLAG